MKKINYIAMDVHSRNIVVAESKENGKSEIMGEYPNTNQGLKRMIKKFEKSSKVYQLKICYEAGPCGYEVKRRLNEVGYECEIVAPSLIPVQAGNRVKTDQRDAKKLARFYRSGELTMVHVPDEKSESVRDLVRCRDDLVGDIRRYKLRIHQFLLRHGHQYSGKSKWTDTYRRWVRGIKFVDTTLKSTLGYYLNNLEMMELQLKEMDDDIQK